MKMTEHNPSSMQYDHGLEVNHQYEGFQQPDHSGLQHRDPHASAPTPPSDSDPKRPQKASARGNPCGLGPLAFGLLVALVTSIVVGAAVGGGVGGALSSSSHSSRYGTFALNAALIGIQALRPQLCQFHYIPQRP
jgi:hypothetical protein